MLLLIDHLALRARNYEYLIRLFQEWEVCVSHAPCLEGAAVVPYPSGPHRVCLGTALGQDTGSLHQSSGSPAIFGFLVTFAEQDPVFLEGVPAAL